MKLLLVLLAAVLVTVQAAPQIKKVQLSVYYESQCPFCIDFFEETLVPIAKELMPQYLEVHLVPYGNAQTVTEGKNVTFVCQHGEDECLVNMMQACALERMNSGDLQKVLMANCFMGHSDTPADAVVKCSKEFGLKQADISACAKGEEGVKLMKKYGEETSKVKPWSGTPTEVLTNMATGTKYQVDTDLLQAICGELATENLKPNACK